MIKICWTIFSLSLVVFEKPSTTKNCLFLLNEIISYLQTAQTSSAISISKSKSSVEIVDIGIGEDLLKAPLGSKLFDVSLIDDPTANGWSSGFFAELNPSESCSCETRMKKVLSWLV